MKRIRVTYRGAVRVALFGMTVLLAGLHLSGQETCDSSLIQADSSLTGYRPRGNRCEGVYRRKVSAFGVQLISFTAQSALRELCASGRPLHLVLPSHAGTADAASITIRGESLRSDLYYRLDVALRSQRSFEWPPNPRCHNEVRLAASELAVMAKTPVVVGQRRVEALLPVKLSTEPSEAVQPPYRALLMPGSRAREVFVSLWHFGGANATSVLFERPLNARPYPPDTPITVVVNPSDLPQRGLYRSRLNVLFESGQSEAVEFYFLNEP